MAETKDIWDILSALSGIIAGLLIAGVGTVATIVYNIRQIKIEQIQALEKYRVLLASSDPAERLFSYEAFVALGYEKLAAKLIAVRVDPAGQQVLAALANSHDKDVRKLATEGLLTLQERNRVLAITNIFETGAAEAPYTLVTAMPNQKLIYGLAWLRRDTPEFRKLIQDYISDPQALHGDSLRGFLSRIEADDATLDTDDSFRGALGRAGEDPVMQTLQDKIFEHRYFEPAVQFAQSVGVKTPLGIAVLYDTAIHHGPAFLRRTKDQLDRELGGNPSTGIDETAWIKCFLKRRRYMLARNPALRHVVSRVDDFQRLAEEGNWRLRPPLNIRGVQVTA
jgi:chitosanase